MLISMLVRMILNNNKGILVKFTQKVIENISLLLDLNLAFVFFVNA